MEEPEYNWNQKTSKRYIPVKGKFLIATASAGCWFAFSLWVSIPWIKSLSEEVGEPLGFLIILFVALVPGFLMFHLLFSILLDKPPPLNLDIHYPPVTVLMAAYNEAENIIHTFTAIDRTEYPADIEIIIVDDGSTDDTVKILKEIEAPNMRIIEAEHGGKAHALNIGLA